jgi:hypothetical protein
MSDSKTKRVQKSRKFRELFLEFLDELREDNERDGGPDRSFSDAPPLDEVSTTDLQEYFDRAGLDVSSPGHWQFLLVALTNAVHLERPGTKAFTREENNAFLRDIAELKKKHDVARPKLCERWVDEERAAGRYPSTPGSSKTRLQDLLAILRELKAEGKATPDEIKWLAIIDTPIRRRDGR